jgi:hypothetical protein
MLIFTKAFLGAFLLFACKHLDDDKKAMGEVQRAAMSFETKINQLNQVKLNVHEREVNKVSRKQFYLAP